MDIDMDMTTAMMKREYEPVKINVVSNVDFRKMSENSDMNGHAIDVRLSLLRDWFPFSSVAGCRPSY